MKNLYHRLLLLIAGSTQKELASQIRYLKIENDILRSKLPKRVPVTEKERNKLVKFGSKLGMSLGERFRSSEVPKRPYHFPCSGQQRFCFPPELIN